MQGAAQHPVQHRFAVVHHAQRCWALQAALQGTRALQRCTFSTTLELMYEQLAASAQTHGSHGGQQLAHVIKGVHGWP